MPGAVVAALIAAVNHFAGPLCSGGMQGATSTAAVALVQETSATHPGYSMSHLECSTLLS
eukprot:scaffold30742_cov36-Prasinocladus_malaysianus.AAC.2